MPEKAKEPRHKRYLYRTHYRFGDRNELLEFNPIGGTELEPEEFEIYVGQAIKELSNDGKSSPPISYDSVMRLCAEIRASLQD